MRRLLNLSGNCQNSPTTPAPPAADEGRDPSPSEDCAFNKHYFDDIKGDNPVMDSFSNRVINVMELLTNMETAETFFNIWDSLIITNSHRIRCKVTP